MRTIEGPFEDGRGEYYAFGFGVIDRYGDESLEARNVYEIWTDKNVRSFLAPFGVCNSH